MKMSHYKEIGSSLEFFKAGQTRPIMVGITCVQGAATIICEYLPAYTSTSSLLSDKALAEGTSVEQALRTHDILQTNWSLWFNPAFLGQNVNTWLKEPCQKVSPGKGLDVL